QRPVRAVASLPCGARRRRGPARELSRPAGRGPPPPTGHGARSYAGTVPVRVPTAARRTGRGSVRGGHDRAFLPLRTAAVAAGPPPPLRRHGPRRLAPPRRPAGDLVDGGADRGGADPSVDPAVPLADGAHGHP